MRAVVAFFDPEGARFEWLLRPGFRHVIAAIDDGTYWLLIDARDGRPVFQMIQQSDYDIAGFWRSEGYAVVEIEQGRCLKSPFVTVNCVGLVKACLCIRAPFALTPYQLYRHLKKARSP